jgi:hypothetical protein
LARVFPLLPEGPGVYAFLSAERKTLYVGKARSLRVRVLRHFGPRPVEAEKSRRLAREAVEVVWEGTGSELEALLLEQRRIRRLHPPLNRQEAVHARKRGRWRTGCALLVLPSEDPREVEVCLVAGDGRFHWERVRRAPRLPRGLWRRLKGFLDGDPGGWAPREAGTRLPADEARALAEVTLSWLVENEDRVNRIDLTRETRGRALAGRVRRLLGEEPSGERVEVV